VGGGSKRRCGSWAFAAVLRGLRSCAVARDRCLRGPSSRGLASSLGDVCSTLLTFAPSFPTRPGPAARTPVWMLNAGSPLSLPSRGERVRAAHSARSSELPLLGLSKDRPSVVLLARESTPGSRLPVARWPAAFGMGMPLPIRVPTSWSCTTSPACSSLSGCAYCSALPTLGFTTFRPVAGAEPTLAGRSDARSCASP